mmetsp:Transcript_9809/g.44741  ORF Transcript_9809/g.44741 Transcript_9809/m.44741 type:complete len:268 (+) Transcript_9809:1121-1924(+)
MLVLIAVWCVDEEFRSEGGSDCFDHAPVSGGERLVHGASNLFFGRHGHADVRCFTDETTDALGGARDRRAGEHGATRRRLRMPLEQLVHRVHVVPGQRHGHAIRPRGLVPGLRDTYEGPVAVCGSRGTQPYGFVRGRVRAVPALLRAARAEERGVRYMVDASRVLPDAASRVAASDHVVPPVVLDAPALAVDPLERRFSQPGRAFDPVDLPGVRFGFGARAVLVVFFFIFKKCHVFLVKHDEVDAVVVILVIPAFNLRVVVRAFNLP